MKKTIFTLSAFAISIAFGTAYSQAEPCKVEISAEIFNVNCFGGDDGSIDVSVIDGKNPVFSWSSGETSEDIYNKNTGVYTLSVSDGDCTIEKEFQIAAPEDPFEVEVSEKTEVTCPGFEDGSLTLMVNGGTGPIEYSIDNGANYSTQEFFSDLAAGEYNIWARDANNCETEIMVELEQPPEVKIDIGTEMEITSGESITIEGPSGFSEYLWSNGKTEKDITFLAEVNEEQTEIISLEVIDENGCTFSSNELKITIQPVEEEETDENELPEQGIEP